MNYRLIANRTADDTATVNSLLLSGGITYNYDSPGVANTVSVTSGNVLSVGATNSITNTQANASPIAFGANEGKIFTVANLTFGAGSTSAITGSAGVTKAGTGTWTQTSAATALSSGITVANGYFLHDRRQQRHLQHEPGHRRCGNDFRQPGRRRHRHDRSFESVSAERRVQPSRPGMGTLTLGGNLTLNVNGAGAAAASITGNLGLGATRISTINDGSAASDLTISAVVSGGGFAVNKAGAGTLTLSGANTYSGGTTIQAGTLSGTVAAAFGTGTVTIGDSSGSNNATLNGGAAVTFANAITVAAGNTGIATITDSAAAAFSGLVTLNNHDLLVQNTGSTLAFSGATSGFTGTGNLLLNSTSASAITLSGTLAGGVNHSGAITNLGTGTATSLISSAVGANVTAIAENSSTSPLTESGLLTTNAAATTLSNNGGALFTVSGGVANTTGNLVLNNNSSLASGITVSGLTGVNNTGTITNSGTGTGSTLISAVVGASVTGVIENSATSTLNLTAANTFTGGLTIKSGTAAGTEREFVRCEHERNYHRGFRRSCKRNPEWRVGGNVSQSNRRGFGQHRYCDDHRQRGEHLRRHGNAQSRFGAVAGREHPYLEWQHLGHRQPDT